jgi:hypothetical protein
MFKWRRPCTLRFDGWFRLRYLLRGELKDVPKGHDCYELYKNI